MLENTRISFDYFCTCHAAWSKLTKVSSQVFSILPAGRVKQTLEPMCVCHIITIRVHLEVNDFLRSLHICLQIVKSVQATISYT